jgi:hypothetical protein
VVDDVLLTLGQRRDCKVWRQRSAVLWTRPEPGAIPLRAVPDSAADVSGVLRGGRRLELECKTEHGTQSDGQKDWEAMINGMGGVYAVVQSGAQAEQVVDEALRGER